MSLLYFFLYSSMISSMQENSCPEEFTRLIAIPSGDEIEDFKSYQTAVPYDSYHQQRNIIFAGNDEVHLKAGDKGEFHRCSTVSDSKKRLFLGLGVVSLLAFAAIMTFYNVSKEGEYGNKHDALSVFPHGEEEQHELKDLKNINCTSLKIGKYHWCKWIKNFLHEHNFDHLLNLS